MKVGTEEIRVWVETRVDVGREVKIGEGKEVDSILEELGKVELEGEVESDNGTEVEMMIGVKVGF